MLSKTETLEHCAGLWLENADARLEDLYQEASSHFQGHILVLDDDPTGVQTVHDVDVVTDWEFQVSH